MKNRAPLIAGAVCLGVVLSACGESPKAVEEEFFSELVVPVSADFSDQDARTILSECDATDSMIVPSGDYKVRLEKSPDLSVDAAACVVDRLIQSGQPAIENFPPPGSVGKKSEADQ